MELNEFFATVLRSLGYPLFSVGGRVCTGGVYGGWNHQLNIVTINGRRYVVDVGFGSNGPLQPNTLEDGREFPQISPARGKLEYKALPIHTDASQRVWEYSTQADPTSPWKPMYAFTEVEFFPADFEVMNLTTMTSPRSFFVQAVMCMRTILDDKTGKPIGLLILLRDYVKRQLGGQAEILENLETEAQRVEALITTTAMCAVVSFAVGLLVPLAYTRAIVARAEIESCLINSACPSMSRDWPSGSATPRLSTSASPTRLWPFRCPSPPSRFKSRCAAARISVSRCWSNRADSYTSLGLGGEDGHLVVEFDRIYHVTLWENYIALYNPVFFLVILRLSFTPSMALPLLTVPALGDKYVSKFRSNLIC